MDDTCKTKAELIAELESLRRYAARLENPAASSESDDLYRRLIGFMPDAVRISCGGVIVYANDAAAALFGKDRPDDLVGRSVQDFNLPEDREIVRDRQRMLLNTGFTPLEGRRKRRLDGSLVHVEVSGMKLDWHGKPAALLVMRDITERVVNRMKRLESQARFVALVGNIPGTVYQCSLDGADEIAFSFLSDGARDMFGVAPDAALADSGALLDAIHPDDRAGFIAAMRNSEATMTVADAEFRVTGEEDGVCWVRSTARPRRRDGGTVVWDGVFLDVTERQAALERMILAKDTAEMASRAKTEFLANMSHELRTPLNTIMGFAEVIEGQMFGPVGTPRYLEYAGDIYSSGEYLLALVNDILDLSKIEAGKLELHDDVVDVEEVIAESLALLRHRTDAGKLRLAVRVASKLPQLRADERRLRQILLNLLSNAAKYTPDGGTVRVSVSATRQGGMSISVVDNGIGMSAEDCERAFRPFQQIDNPQNHASPGTGLGLPLARSLVEGHGGRLALASSPGKGTRVTVRFPPMRLVA